MKNSALITMDERKGNEAEEEWVNVMQDLSLVTTNEELKDKERGEQCRKKLWYQPIKE